MATTKKTTTAKTKLESSSSSSKISATKKAPEVLVESRLQTPKPVEVAPLTPVAIPLPAPVAEITPASLVGSAPTNSAPMQMSQPIRRPINQVMHHRPVQPGRVEMINGRRVWRSPGVAPVDNDNGFGGLIDGRRIPDAGLPTEELTGILDMNRDGSGILRSEYSGSDRDAYISSTQIRRFRFRPGP